MIARLLLPVIATALVLPCSPAWSQAYPSKAIRVVVPFSSGGPADLVARLVGHGMQPILGQSLVVENRAGAGGSIGARAVAAAEPDGYTLLIGNTATLVINAIIYKRSDYDPATAFVPIANIATSSNVLVVSPALPVASVADLIAYAKANPGRLNYSSPGIGTPAHLIAEMFKLRAGIDLVHVPYKAGGVSAQDVAAGQVQLTFENPATALPFVRGGGVRALAVTGEARNPLLPEVPTMGEAGIADFVTVSLIGLVAPAGTSTPVVAKLNEALNQSLRTADVQAAFARLALDIRGGSSEEFAAALAREREKWGAIARIAKVQVD